MIIKNPYKILVKHYRLINLLLLIPIIYLLFICTNLSRFFDEFVAASYYTAETNLAELYIPGLALIVPIVFAIFNFIIWLLFYLKKKKNYYHIISAGYQLVLFVCLVFLYSSLLNLEMSKLDNTFYNFLRDISGLIIYPIYVLIIMGAINVVGLNIKTLRFDKHEDLKITDEDEEDIEVKVGSDSIDTKKRFVHILRELKYYVIENKIIICIIIVAIVGMISYKAFLNYQIYNRTYNLNQSFILDNFTFSVKDSYITRVDYHGKVITKNKYYLAVKISIKNNNSDSIISKDTFRIHLDDKELFPSYDKGSRFIDIGLPYKGQTIARDEKHDYVFVYELTENQLKGKYEMRILNNLTVEDNQLNASYKKINIRPKNISKSEKKWTKSINEKVTFTDSTLEKTNYKLKKVSIQPSYKYSYKLCYTERNCSNYEDTIVPSGGKMLMIVEDIIDYDSTIPYYAYKEKNFYEDFVSIEYTFNVKTGSNPGPVTQTSNLVDITPKQLKDVKVFEVSSNLQSSYKINFIFTIRNKIYTMKVLE